MKVLQIDIIFIVFLLVITQIISSCESYTLEPKFWTYKGHSISYEVAYNNNNKDEKISNRETEFFRPHHPNDDPILLLNGFGVGSFHQHRLIPHLLSPSTTNSNLSNELNNQNPSRLVYGVDYLGQGRSWPIACEDGDAECEKGLIYSADSWADQIILFIEEVIIPDYQAIQGQKKSVKVHILGNSVGGYLSVIISLIRPDLVSSITLLNATPVWGLNLPGWSGHLPAPCIPKKIGRYFLDRIRDLKTIETCLEMAYYNRSAFGENLIQQIRACTEGPGRHDALASIMWSPPTSSNNMTQTNFCSMLANVQCDVLLIFGKNDPWCKIPFAKKMLISLNQRSGFAHRLVELKNVGHCPNHEAPKAVSHVVNQWLSSKERDQERLNLVDTNEGIISLNEQEGNKQREEYVAISESWGDVGMREVDLKEAMKMSLIDKLVVQMVMGKLRGRPNVKNNRTTLHKSPDLKTYKTTPSLSARSQPCLNEEYEILEAEFQEEILRLSLEKGIFEASYGRNNKEVEVQANEAL